MKIASMKLVFHTARHYWLNGKNATWSISPLFDQQIFKWIKDRYSSLENSRISTKQIESCTLFFFYSDKQDIYGRNITEVTAILTNALFRNPESIRSLIAPHLKQQGDSILDFSLTIQASEILDTQTTAPCSYQAKARSPSHKSILTLSSVIVVGLVVLMAFVIYSKDRSRRAATTEPVVRRNYDEPGKSQPKKDQVFPPLAPKAETPGASDGKTVSIEFCRKFRAISKRDETLRIDKCFSAYIEDQCGGVKREPYRKWLENHTGNVGCENVKPQREDKDLKEWKWHNRENSRLIDDFFSGKE